MGLMAKEECLIFHPMVFLWNSCCQFLSHYVCFVPVVLIVLILVVPYSHHVVSRFPLGVLHVKGCPEQGDIHEASA